MKTLNIIQPDDWHVHLRDGEALADTVSATARHVHRALAMPNLRPALTSVQAVLSYRERIISSLANAHDFIPYMTLYLTESIPSEEFVRAAANPYILGAKLYPAGATTHSEEGVTSLTAIYPLLDLMQENELVLQIHGETTQGDIFDREPNFLTECLAPIIKNFPKLRIVLEHISTQAAVDFVVNAPRNVAATITPHHLLYNRNHILAGGIRPHYYCLPILKRENDQRALRQVAVSGNPKFFAGTDSAPHSRDKKETQCGCAGIYSAPFAIALYTQIFDEMGQLERLEGFTSRYGAEFYHLPISKNNITLQKTPQQIPDSLPLGDKEVIPIAAGATLPWSIYESS